LPSNEQLVVDRRFLFGLSSDHFIVLAGARPDVIEQIFGQELSSAIKNSDKYIYEEKSWSSGGEKKPAFKTFCALAIIPKRKGYDGYLFIRLKGTNTVELAQQLEMRKIVVNPPEIVLYHPGLSTYNPQGS